MTARLLREWRGVKPVAAPAGAAISARLHTTAEEERVLDAVAAHLGSLRRAELAAVSCPRPVDDPGLDGELRRAVRRGRLARDAQYRHGTGLRAAIATIEARLAAPTIDVLTVWQRKARRKAREPKGYASQAERCAKQRRVQQLRAELTRTQQDRAAGRVHVVEGGKRLAHTRHHLGQAGLTEQDWRAKWNGARYRITANGSPDEPFGNLTITVTSEGEVSVRLPKPLEHLANASRGRYRLSGRAVFAHRGDEWAQRITTGNSVSYTISRKPGHGGRYLTASWAIPSLPYRTRRDDSGAGDDAYGCGPVVGVDLNDGHLAVRRLDVHGNPVGAAERIDIRHRPDRQCATPRRPGPPRDQPAAKLHPPARHLSDCG